MIKKIITLLLILIFTSNMVFAEQPKEENTGRFANYTELFAWALDVDTNNFWGSLGVKVGEELQGRISSMAMEWIGDIVGEVFPIAKIFTSLFGGSGGDTVMQQNFDKIIGMLEQNHKLIKESTEKIINSVYQSYLTANVWNKIDTISDQIHSSRYESNKQYWNTLIRWNENLRNLSNYSNDATAAVNGWEKANNIDKAVNFEQYKTFQAYLNAVGMEIYTVMEYKNVLGALEAIELNGQDIQKGLDMFQNEYENYYKTTIKNALSQIVFDAFTHISTMVNDWRGASDGRFKNLESKNIPYGSSSVNPYTYIPSSTTNIPLKKEHILYNRLKPYDTVHQLEPGPQPVVIFKYSFYINEYTYTRNGKDMQITVCKIRNNLSGSVVKTLIVTPFSFHTFTGFSNTKYNGDNYTVLSRENGYFVYETTTSVDHKIDELYAMHKHFEYINYSQQGLEPGLETIDEWYEMINSTRTPLQAERDLQSYYAHFRWDVVDHSTIISAYKSPSDIVIQNGGVLSILNGGGMTYSEYQSLCELLETTRDSRIVDYFLTRDAVNRAGNIELPLFRKLRVKSGGTLIIPENRFNSLLADNQLVIESGAKVIKLDSAGMPPEPVDISVIMTIINTILFTDDDADVPQP